MVVTHRHRVQAVLSDEQYALLLQLGREQGKPISLLIREAVEQTYVAATLLRKRRDALSRLLSLEAPVADWPQMEKEIEQGASHGDETNRS